MKKQFEPCKIEILLFTKTDLLTASSGAGGGGGGGDSDPREDNEGPILPA